MKSSETTLEIKHTFALAKNLGFLGTPSLVVGRTIVQGEGPMVEERVQRRLAAILAPDVVGYSRLVGEEEEGTLATPSLEGRPLSRSRFGKVAVDFSPG